jgi:hypothetical protein
VINCHCTVATVNDIHVKDIKHKIINQCIRVCSCEIVALRENFVDRPESYDAFKAKSCIFLAHEKTHTLWDIFLHPHTQPAPKQGIKIFLRHLTTTRVPSLILKISDIVQSSIESHTLEFIAHHIQYWRSRSLVT